MAIAKPIGLLLCCLAVAAISGRATSAADSSSNPAPVVFNASSSARAGDVVSLQGDYFGPTPVVVLTTAQDAPLEIVNRVGEGWLAVQIPADAVGELTLRVRTTAGSSGTVKLNAAQPLHLDALQLAPGGAFRIFGRNLLLPGSTPSVMVDGKPAVLDLARSNEHMLSAVAPTALRATAAATLMVDNGNGSGAALLARKIEVSTSGSGDPFALGVGWGAGFAAVAATLIDATADVRLATKLACDGTGDDSGAIQAAIGLAAGGGGGVVQLPAGRCRLAKPLTLHSRVVLQGAGKAATELAYESDYPILGKGIDLAGVRNLTLRNAGPATEALLLKDSSRVFLQNLRIQLGTSRQMYLSGNRNVVIAGVDVEQAGSVSHQGPYILEGSNGLVFEGNTTRWVDGAPAFGRVHDAVIHNNRFTRDAANQDKGGTVHSLVLDFAHRVAVIGNTFDVAGGPITNLTRNDGEALLSEGGGAGRTENLGTVAGAGRNTLTDPSNTLRTDPFGSGTIPENYGVAIVAGRGAGQTRRVVAYRASTLTLDRAWDVVPDRSSRYASFVWGLEQALIKENRFSQNPRGIWLYHAAMRNVDVIDNTIAEGGGIYLRSYQNLATKSFMPMFNMLIARNTVSNTTGRWMSYINSVFVNADARAFGIATVGVEMRGNQITANWPNVSSQLEEYANTEGFMNMMRVEHYSSEDASGTPRLLGTLLSDNTCSRCDAAVRVGTGAAGSTLINTRLVNTPALLQDWATTPSGDKSVGTVIR